MSKTHNGATALRTSKSACLDLFSVIGSARRMPAAILHLFERAFAEDAALALRVLLWCRDARGGAGERDTFRHILHWLERRHPEVALKLLRSGKIQFLGRWDDVLTLRSPAALAEIAGAVKAALEGGDRLAAKWLPRKGPVAAQLAKQLGWTSATWRKRLAHQSDTVEQKICARNWPSIQYKAVPSCAATRYGDLFARRDTLRYREYLADVKAGKATMNASVSYPHEIMRFAYRNDEAASAQWSQLPKPALAGQALVLSDVSGSMLHRVSGNTTAMDVSVALGLFLSESLPEPFRNKVMTFSSQPAFHTVTGTTLRERADNLLAANWAGSTNIQAAFELILSLVEQHSVPMPKALIVLSDMEFDQADCKGRTNHASMCQKFESRGYAIPTLIYWNLVGRAGNVPVADVPGAVLVSGFSPRIAEAVLSGDFENLSPTRLMLAVVSNPRYDI